MMRVGYESRSESFSLRRDEAVQKQNVNSDFFT